MIERPDNGCEYLHDARIDPEQWLESMAEPIEVELPDDDSRIWPDSIEVRHAIERHAHDADDESPTEYRLVAHDNVYNQENDFGNHFVFAVYAPAGSDSDWFYADGCYVAVSFGRSGDPRGAYSGISVWKFHWPPAECGFLDWCIGWWLTVDGQECGSWSERCQIGYASNPTCELARVLAELRRNAGERLSDDDIRFGTDCCGQWRDGRYVVELADGGIVEAVPYIEAEHN